MRKGDPQYVGLINQISRHTSIPPVEVEAILRESVTCYNRVEEIASTHGRKAEGDWKAGFYHGLERALVIQGADEGVVVRCRNLMLNEGEV